MELTVDVNSPEYRESKIKYFKLIEANKEWLQKSYLCTTEQIQTRIKELILNPQNNENMAAVLKDGRLRLHMKESQSESKEILTLDDSFDCILRKHVEWSHADAAITYQAVSKEYAVVMFCIDAVIESCSFCAKTNALKSKTEVRRGVWRMNIIRDENILKPRDLHGLTYLLILKEDATNFILLRALYPSLKQAALELLRLFAEFNYPKKILVPNNLECYLMIMKIVQGLNPLPKMPEILESDNKDVFEEDKKEVLKEIEEWSKMEKDCYWDQYCHMVQYKMNTTQKDLTRLDPKQKDNGVPFKLFFKHEPRSLQIRQ